MTKLREIIIQIIIILLAATVVLLAVMPLENTSWADGIRTGTTVEEGGAGSQPDGFGDESGERQTSGAIAYVASFIKITLFMGIPGLITLGILRLTNRKPKAITGGAS